MTPGVYVSSTKSRSISLEQMKSRKHITKREIQLSGNFFFPTALTFQKLQVLIKPILVLSLLVSSAKLSAMKVETKY